MATKKSVTKKIEKLEAGNPAEVKAILNALENVQSNNEGTIRYGKKGNFYIVVIDPKEKYVSQSGKCFIRATTHGIRNLEHLDDGSAMGISVSVLQTKSK